MLQTELEQVYTKLKEALRNRDWDVFVSQYAKSPARSEEEIAQWKRLTPILDRDAYPNLSDLIFVTIKVNADTAGYIVYKENPELPDWIHVYMLKFIKEPALNASQRDACGNAVWKLEDIPHAPLHIKNSEEIQAEILAFVENYDDMRI